MNIVLLIEKIRYGGAEKQLLWLANVLSQKHKVILLSYKNNKREYYKKDNIDCYIEKYERESKKNIDFVRSIFLIRKFLKVHSTDLVITYSMYATIRANIACMFLKCKVIASQRNDPYHIDNTTLIEKTFNKIYEYADYYVFQTVGAKEFYSKKIQARSIIIPNAVKKSIYRSKTITKEKRIVSVGRLDIRQKRQDILIKAFQLIENEIPDYVLEIIGDGPDESMLKEIANNNPKIIFSGAISNVVQRISNAALFVLSSDFEGIPNSLMEAMSIGLPCIATKCSPGGAELLIKNRENGILIDCGNISELSKEMLNIINNPEISNKISKNAVKICNEFSEKIIANRWLDYVEQVGKIKV